MASPGTCWGHDRGPWPPCLLLNPLMTMLYYFRDSLQSYDVHIKTAGVSTRMCHADNRHSIVRSIDTVPPSNPHHLAGRQ